MNNFKCIDNNLLVEFCNRELNKHKSNLRKAIERNAPKKDINNIEKKIMIFEKMKEKIQTDSKDSESVSNLETFIENRLLDYGFSSESSSIKYRVYSSIKNLINISLGKPIDGVLSNNDRYEAIRIIDNILPSKSKNNSIVEKSKKDSELEFQKLIDNDIYKLVEYLEDKSRIDVHGMAGPECYVNKEALRMSATYIRDYINILESDNEVYINGKIIVRLGKIPGKYPTLDKLLADILENSEHVPCWKRLTSRQKLEWDNFIKDNQDLEVLNYIS